MADFPFDPQPDVYRSFVGLTSQEENHLEEPVFRGLAPLSLEPAASFWAPFDPFSEVPPPSKPLAHKATDRTWAALEPIGVPRKNGGEKLEPQEAFVEWLQTDQGPFSSAMPLEAAVWTEPLSSFHCVPAAIPHAVLNHVCTSLAAAHIPFSAHPECARVEGRVESGASFCSFVLCAFREATTSGSGALSVFELQRRHGCVLLFADLFQRVIGWLGAAVMEERPTFTPWTVAPITTTSSTPLENLGEIPPPLTLGVAQPPLELTSCDAAALLTMLDCTKQDVQIEGLRVLATAARGSTQTAKLVCETVAARTEIGSWMEKLSCLSQQPDHNLHRWAGLLISSVQEQQAQA